MSYKKRGILPKFLFRNDFQQRIRFTPGDISSRGDHQNTNRRFVIAPADNYFVVRFDDVRRLGRTSVEQNKTRIAKLLSN